MEGTKIKVAQLKKARIEIIPLIDVIFFLLATFVLFTLSLNRIQSVKVDLPFPQQNNTPPPPGSEPVSIQISDAGSIYWNKEPIEQSELASYIANYKTTTDDWKIMVSGDDKARFGALVVVLDEIKKAGIEKFSVETRTRPTGR
jgi:biopolymer transport protein ExbD